MSMSRAFDIFSTTNFCHVFAFSLASWIYFDRIGLDGTVSKMLACLFVYPLMYMPLIPDPPGTLFLVTMIHDSSLLSPFCFSPTQRPGAFFFVLPMSPFLSIMRIISSSQFSGFWFLVYAGFGLRFGEKRGKSFFFLSLVLICS